jgi:hypothetical protein
MRFISFFPILILMGCGPIVTKDNIDAVTTQQLCQAIMGQRSNSQIGDEGGTLALAELNRRGTFSSREIGAIEEAGIYVGMREEAALCAWGYFWYDENMTTTSGGTTTQYVFGDGSYNPRKYLYVSNGIVTATQQ